MCVVSMIQDYGRDRIGPEKWTPGNWEVWKDFISKAEEVDKVLDQPDCTDPAKAAWMKAMEERLKELETRTKINFQEELVKATEELRKQVDEAYRKFNERMENVKSTKNSQ